jgi:4-amino-4-deoxy-L-arabinose transferase-like glycosyltransferase
MQAEQSKSRYLLYLWGIVFVYFSFNALAQFVVSGTAEFDQAEQLILSQTFQLGYSAQQPLYTYIVRIIFSFTGPGLAPLLGLKAVLLSSLIGLFIALGVQFNFTIRQHLIAVVGVVFIPQLIWESQRDLTHSVLATTIAAATLLQIIRTQRRPTTINYVVLGLSVGLGLISKYNYALFLTALSLAVLSTPRFRSLLTDRRALAALLVVLIVSAPHIIWVISNYEIAASSAEKLHANRGNLFSGFAHAAFSALAFLTPLWVLSIFLISSPFKSKNLETAGPESGKFMLNLFIATIIVVMIFLTVTGTQQVKDRWYQPLLFYVPLIVALFVTPTQARLKWYLGLGVVVAVLISIALPARTVLAERFNILGRLNIPYPSLLASMSDSTWEPAFIIAETTMLAGNSRPFYPNAKIHVPAYSLNLGPVSGIGIVVCETPYCRNNKFKLWLKHNYAIHAKLLKFNKIERPYYYAPSQNKSIYWSRVQMSPSVNP